MHHETGHAYFSNESLAQLVEGVVYDVGRTGSTDMDAWPHLRDWPGVDASNQDVHALLDIYHLIGYDAVTRALRAIDPLGTPYGEPLCEACVQALVDEAPAALKETVRAKAERVRF